MKKITLLFTILTASFGFSQNGGDTCGAAVAVTPGSFTQTEITGTGAELGTGVGSAWFVYTPTEDASIVVSSCNGGSDTYLAIGTGTCGSLNLAGSNDDFCSTSEGGSALHHKCQFLLLLEQITTLSGVTDGVVGLLIGVLKKLPVQK